MTLAIDTSIALAAPRATSSPAPSQPSSSEVLSSESVSSASGPSSNAGVDVAAYGAVSDGLARATSIADPAQAATGSVLQILQQLKQTATDVVSGVQAGSAANGDFHALVDQLQATVASASASGVNLIDGSASPGVQVAADAGGGQATLTAYDLSPGGPTVSVGAGASVDTASAAAVTLGQVQSSLEATGGVLANLATQAKQISAHADFVATLGAAAGVGRSDGADSARLQALQLRQSLFVHGGGIANAAPQAVLSLFRS